MKILWSALSHRATIMIPLQELSVQFPYLPSEKKFKLILLTCTLRTRNLPQKFSATSDDG